MAVTDESRHDLYTYFDETMGRQRAATMMELLPPVGWGDVATKQDLEQLATRFDVVATREDLYKLEARLLARMNTQMLAMIGVNTTLLGLCVGVVTLLR